MHTIGSLHRMIAGEVSLPARMRTLADAFLGLPRVQNPLSGANNGSEGLIVDVNAFDCVTLIETVLCLARTRSRAGFINELKKTRYRDGVVTWPTRHHYFSDWMKYNQKRGVVKIRTRGQGSRPIEATLGFIDDLRPRRARFQIVPKSKLSRALPRISDGSIIAFASLRANLDFFHTGLLFDCNDDLMLYHAPQRFRRVIAEPLSRFLKRERMRGIAFAAPVDNGVTQ